MKSNWRWTRRPMWRIVMKWCRTRMLPMKSLIWRWCRKVLWHLLIMMVLILQWLELVLKLPLHWYSRRRGSKGGWSKRGWGTTPGPTILQHNHSNSSSNPPPHFHQPPPHPWPSRNHSTNGLPIDSLNVMAIAIAKATTHQNAIPNSALPSAIPQHNSSSARSLDLDLD